MTSLAAARAPFWSPLLLAGAMMAGSRVEPPTFVCSHLQRVRLLSSRGNFEFDSVHNMDRSQGSMTKPPLSDTFFFHSVRYRYDDCFFFSRYDTIRFRYEILASDMYDLFSRNLLLEIFFLGKFLVQRSDDIPTRQAQAPPFHWTCCQLQENSEGLKIQIYYCYAF